MKKTGDSDIRELTAVEVVKSNPQVYWGVENLTYKAINESILSQLEEENCKGLEANKIFDWHIITSNTNWISLSNKTINELFDTAHWFPGGGGNGFRFEYFLKVVASDICVYEKNCLHELKGKVEEIFSSELERNFKDKTCVAYKFKYEG